MQRRLVEGDWFYLPLSPASSNYTASVLSHHLDDIDDPQFEQTEFDRRGFERGIAALTPRSERVLRIGAPSTADAYAAVTEWLVNQTSQLMIADGYNPDYLPTVDVDVVVVPDHGRWERLAPLK